MSPSLVSSACPLLPGLVPKTTFPPENSWLTGVTLRLSLPSMFSTQTLSSLVAISESEPAPT